MKSVMPGFEDSITTGGTFLDEAPRLEWWRGTMATRANDAAVGPAVIVHQRLNARDLTGYLLAEWCPCLFAEYARRP